MATLTRDGLDLQYTVTGAGPALLLPILNHPWEVLDVPLLARQFTVITASPRGFMASGFKHASFPGRDHEGMLTHVNEALPSVLAWFGEQAGAK
jgi:hypothetical protein